MPDLFIDEAAAAQPLWRALYKSKLQQSAIVWSRQTELCHFPLKEGECPIAL
jgi:hypothetical protein